MSRVFDLICIRSFDFIVWWFDIDFILFDFIFDVLASITFILIFIIGFFIRLLFSFIFVLLIINSLNFITMSHLVTIYVIVFISALYNFINYIFSIGIILTLYYFETIQTGIYLISIETISISNNVNQLFGLCSKFWINYCSFIFCLFNFVIQFFFAFIFFIMRSLFVIILDFFFSNFDIQFLLQGVKFIYIDFITLNIIPFNFIWSSNISLFSFYFFCNIVYIVCYFLITCLYNYNILNFGFTNWITKVFYNLVAINKQNSNLILSILIFFKFLFNEIFFIFSFVIIIFVSSLFGFIVKDYMFISSNQNLENDCLYYNHKFYNEYLINTLLFSIENLLTL